jgi:hypothetical protein
MAFANAKTIAKPETKAKKAEAPVVQIVGVEEHAALDAVIKSLLALQSSLAEEIKADGAEHFIEAGCALKKAPPNFRAIEGTASSSLELKKRSSASHLTETDVELLKEAGISIKEKIVTVGTYVINPAYKDDVELLEKVESALSGVEGIPEDFMMIQEEDKKFVTTEESLDELFTKDPAVVADLISIVGTMALKPTLTISDIAHAHGIVSKLVDKQLKASKEAK